VSEPRRGESSSGRLADCDASIITYRPHFLVLPSQFVFRFGSGISNT
jgi:hypothetical protein